MSGLMRRSPAAHMLELTDRGHGTGWVALCSCGWVRFHLRPSVLHRQHAEHAHRALLAARRTS